MRFTQIVRWLVIPACAWAMASAVVAETRCADMFDHDFRRLHSKDQVDLCELINHKPVLVVNTASHCGFTPQYKSLEALHQEYSDRGLVVLGFASNDFNQETKDEAESAKICYINHGVTFTMLAATPVKGKEANPVFKELNKRSEEPKWNFNKYLVDNKTGQVLHFDSNVTPQSAELIEQIERLL